MEAATNVDADVNADVDTESLGFRVLLAEVRAFFVVNPGIATRRVMPGWEEGIIS